MVEETTTPDERVPINIQDEMRRSYMEYAMSVIIGRALPDVRDGLKPVHRRSLYAMYDLKNFYNQAYKKSARVVGDVIGKYHPHGDQAVYDTIVRMAQSFSMRYLLVDGQGNFGSVDGDRAAAMRYTEVRLTQLAGSLLSDLDKQTVDFVPNYDGSMSEPSVLPAPYPNLLVNGSSGIAVGMATNMPPHNMREVVDATVALINDPELTSIELMEQFIPGPDFPTGGIILGSKGIVDAYTTGRGRVRVRAKTHFEASKKNGDDDVIVVTELPYQVNKSRLAEKIGNLVKDKKLEGIRTIRDESDRSGMRFVIECKRDAQPQVVLNQLYKSTELQTTFGVMNLAVVKGQPKILTLKELISHFIDHRRDVMTRRCLYELDQKEKREHILEGYVIALDNIDEIITIIKASASPEAARTSLMNRFGLSKIQAESILQMRLQRLTGLERDKVHAELSEVRTEIARLKAILADERLLLDEIIKELNLIGDKHSDVRRTEILPFEGDLSMADLIADEEIVLTISKAGYIKRTPLTEYQTQKRAGKGRIGATTKDEDLVIDMFSASNHDTLLVFSSLGKVYSIMVYEVPEGGRYSRGKPIVNLVPFEKEEKITSVLAVKEFSEGHYLLFATQKGLIKKTDLMSYSKVRSSGIYAIAVQEGDRVIGIRALDDQEVMLTSRNGNSVRFRHADVRPTGRNTRGVRGMALRDGDEVVSMQLLEPEKSVLMVTEHGFGKRVPIDQFRITKRGGLGVKSMPVTDRNGHVIGARLVDDTDQAMLVTDGGMMIRFRVQDVREMSRYAGGVRLVRLRKGEAVMGLERLADVDEDDEVDSLATDEDVSADEPTPEDIAAEEAAADAEQPDDEEE